jgi:hypothetical protein
LIPRDCAAQGILSPDDAPRMNPNSAVDNPEEARTHSSAASSMRRRIDVTDRKTPGSMGGGVGLSSAEMGNEGGVGKLV